ncbi:TIGR03619 family F420-dependent LLM class oxidoreductase [Mycobacterium kubicae]|uniref:TIGR03619 family F420-dependent LLM class oxidoreductase n=1 Tax=Mycobacterium kubicae TaxID=120959 RepID=UPI001FD36F7A|nr:TIGR03619 family F420-dependent LLM class oxidoreductase [Mycobacterium kubicae]
MAAVSPTASAGIVTQVVGCTLPQFGELAHADVAAFAAATEQLGVDSLWVADRLLAPVDPTALHAGMRGAIPEHYRTIADPLIALSVAATVTTTVRLGASVLVGPWYPPVQLARQLTTIDAVSDGRLLPGFGVGWSPDEYCASGARFEDRGALLDELLDVLIALWTTSPVEHQGVHWSIPPSRVDFKPVQRPRPPIGLGAFTGAGLRRVGERADCWLPVVWASDHVDLSPLHAQRNAVDAAARAVGRDSAEITAQVRVNVAPGTPLVAVAATTRRLADNGYPDSFVELMWAVEDIDSQLEWIEKFAAL